MAGNPLNSKKVYADYYLGFFTREVSGRTNPWMLYYNKEVRKEDGTIGRRLFGFSGDLYASPDLKDICSTYYPIIGPYDTTDEDTAEYHVLLAKASGIDGFFVEYHDDRDEPLFNLLKVSKRYDFEIGVNWINQCHNIYQESESRKEVLERAKRILLFLLENVYMEGGVHLDGHPLLLIFITELHARSPKAECFTPEEIQELRETANRVGYDPLILASSLGVLGGTGEPFDPQQKLEKLSQVCDGFYPWVIPHGSPVRKGEIWTHKSDRQHQRDYLKRFYEECSKLQEDGRISTYMGCVTPGFDDHKGQGWGTLERRHIPRDNGQTLMDTWKDTRESGADIAFIVTWNDWEEASHIEPSLELGYEDIQESARQIWEWKEAEPKDKLLRLPERLFHMRKRGRFFAKVGLDNERIIKLNELINKAAFNISQLNEIKALKAIEEAEDLVDKMMESICQESVSLMWEFGVQPAGIEPCLMDEPELIELDGILGMKLHGETVELKCRLSESVRGRVQRGHLAARLSIEYLDVGTDYIQVRVDAEDEEKQVIAEFRKNNTGRWARASLDLVNARWVKGLPDGADFIISQRRGTMGGIRLVRIDGVLHSMRS